ncbi:nitrate reductase molybdenum cofactor assembly chaperone [Amycolatopsis suaedae]|uniref:Nitrate reductase molybdenum cofactor assembly chaperone n=1 Tax=Amycolatopsis suaedae TaxID=2510978 RepID=A0A4Q7JAW4_9PSEU|nr:nitrate reductase molybdenum cofactor assembly chaperone [Amycolatopsis suaedae]RZQ63364.1 nitrate reductase molybdenum cofactor assembly chaperone [Amycolatopsis suaedae]
MSRDVVRQVAGWCLQYPDSGVLSKLPLLRACAEEAGHAGLARVLDHLGGPPAELAAHYVETFDRKPRRTLHLTWFTDGDTRRRGTSLATLKRLYREHGFVLAENELPDFLPVILEFSTAVRDRGAAEGVLLRFRPALELLHRNLVSVTPYAEAVAAVIGTLPPPDPESERLAASLAETGPPAELVGLEPFGVGR